MPPQQNSYSRKEHKQTYDQQRCTDNRDLPYRILDLDGFPPEQVPQAKHTLFSSHGIFHSFYLSGKAVFLHYPPFCPSAACTEHLPDRSQSQKPSPTHSDIFRKPVARTLVPFLRKRRKFFPECHQFRQCLAAPFGTTVPVIVNVSLRLPPPAW